MAKWIEITHNYDHRWPSGSVTALLAGSIVYVKEEVADGAIDAGAANETSKPDREDERHQTTGTSLESDVAVQKPMIEDRAVKSGGFPGYPSHAERVRAALAEVAAGDAPGDRSEPVEVTVADNEATLMMTEASDKAKAKGK